MFIYLDSPNASKLSALQYILLVELQKHLYYWKYFALQTRGRYCKWLPVNQHIVLSHLRIGLITFSDHQASQSDSLQNNANVNVSFTSATPLLNFLYLVVACFLVWDLITSSSVRIKNQTIWFARVYHRNEWIIHGLWIFPLFFHSKLYWSLVVFSTVFYL